MARKERITEPGIYHIINRGVERRDIFQDDSDYNFFLELGWNREYDLKELVDDMMQSDLKLMTKDVYLQDGGYKTLSYFE